MSKSDAIAEIVRNLHKLSIEENQEVLQLIKSKTGERSKSRKVVHTNIDGTELNEGDSVYLLTKGVYNRKGEEGAVHKLPQTVGKYITFIRRRQAKHHANKTYLRKLGTSVRKVPDDQL